MKNILKRLVSYVLAVLMLISVPLQAFAETTGKGMSGYVPVPSPGKGSGGGSGNPNGTYPDYGFRVTFTDSHQIANSMTDLTGGYTREDLENQRSAVEAALGQMYIEPGDGGIYFYNGQYSVTPYYGVATSTPGEGYSIIGTRIKMKKGSTVGVEDNELAWYCYPGVEGGSRQSSIECDTAMYEALTKATNNYATGGDYIYDLRQKFMAHKGFTTDQELLSYLRVLLAEVISDGSTTVQNIQNFSWDTVLSQGAGVEVTASDLVMWSRIGYLTMLIQFAWLAQLSGDTGTYGRAETLIWDYVQGGYKSEVMPLLEIEACQLVGLDGDNQGVSSLSQLITLPYTLSATYDSDVVKYLYNGWTGNICDALAEYIGTRAQNSMAKGWIKQGFGGYFQDGAYYNVTSGSYVGRAYHRLLRPTDNQDASFGYIIAFTYAADVPNWESGGTPTGAVGAVPGSFTWKLTPSGVNDETPDTEVNATSTVYEINMSQNGANSNNYDKWKTYVQQYGGNNNQLRITVYRTSEDLSADDKAKKYTREQVMQQGKNATTGFDRVIVGSAKITGIPGIGEVKSGEAATGISNDQLLTILDQAKSMTLSEIIKGSLEMWEGVDIYAKICKSYNGNIS